MLPLCSRATTFSPFPPRNYHRAHIFPHFFRSSLLYVRPNRLSNVKANHHEFKFTTWRYLVDYRESHLKIIQIKNYANCRRNIPSIPRSYLQIVRIEMKNPIADDTLSINIENEEMSLKWLIRKRPMKIVLWQIARSACDEINR